MNKSLIEEKKKKCLLIGYSSPKMKMYNTGVWTASSDTDSMTCSAVSLCFLFIFCTNEVSYSQSQIKGCSYGMTSLPIASHSFPFHQYHSLSLTLLEI